VLNAVAHASLAPG